MRGELDGCEISLPWLEQVELLVLDGFFDFTPVQSEMLRYLIPRIPNVTVNLNGDQRNQSFIRVDTGNMDDLRPNPFTNTIRVTVMNLRRKLGDPPVIETVVGSGYRIVTS